MNSSSSVAELGLDESQSNELESLELPEESREAVVVLSELEDMLEEARRSVRTMEMRGESWRGRICPL